MARINSNGAIQKPRKSRARPYTPPPDFVHTAGAQLDPETPSRSGVIMVKLLAQKGYHGRILQSLPASSFRKPTTLSLQAIENFTRKQSNELVNKTRRLSTQRQRKRSCLMRSKQLLG